MYPVMTVFLKGSPVRPSRRTDLEFSGSPAFLRYSLISSWLAPSNIGVSVRKNLTDTIKKCVTDEGNFKNWAYSTYSKLVYKKVLGKDVKKAKIERNVKEKENIRDYLTIEELEKVQDLESKIATFIEFTDTSNMTDKEVYAMVKIYIEK